MVSTDMLTAAATFDLSAPCRRRKVASRTRSSVKDFALAAKNISTALALQERIQQLR